MLLWLWCRLVAMALIRPLAWEPPGATGAALEKAKRKKRQKTQQNKTCITMMTKRVKCLKLLPGHMHIFLGLNF